MGLTLCPEGVSSSSSITLDAVEHGPKLGSVRIGLRSVLSRLDTTDWLREQRATCLNDGRKPIHATKKDRNKGNNASSILNFLVTELVLNTSHMNAINFENLKFTAQRI